MAQSQRWHIKRSMNKTEQSPHRQVIQALQRYDLKCDVYGIKHAASCGLDCQALPPERIEARENRETPTFPPISEIFRHRDQAN